VPLKPVGAIATVAAAIVTMAVGMGDEMGDEGEIGAKDAAKATDAKKNLKYPQTWP
jgi:hypothetical protein